MYKALSSLHSPCSRGGLGTLQWGRLLISSLPLPLWAKSAKILQEQCPKPPDCPGWDGEMTLSSCSRNEPALLNRHWLKSRAGMGGREAPPVCRGTPQGGKATGPSSENNWSETKAYYCTKEPEGRQWILDSPLPHLQPPFKRRKQQRHVQSHGHAFGEFRECPKEHQQKNIQFLHLGLNYV